MEMSETQAARDVLAERRRQIDVEEWATQHDDRYTNGELERAAAAYALISCRPVRWFVADIWPFSSKWWKPRSHRENLIRAAALLLAAIERLDRQAARS
ncbi:hypothetical protein [Rhizobium sp. 12,4]|uniref:hypothetical protein n=1 Tax=Rhizobium sp. 12,4 TaxID=3405135 RepID=UPI003D3475A7